MSFSKISITGNGGTPSGLQVLVNGQPMPGLRSLTLNLDVDKANTVTLDFFTDEIQVDAEALAVLEAIHVKDGGKPAEDELVERVMEALARKAQLNGEV